MLIHGMDTRRVLSQLLTVIVCFALAFGPGTIAPIFAAGAPGGALSSDRPAGPPASGGHSSHPTALPSPDDTGRSARRTQEGGSAGLPGWEAAYAALSLGTASQAPQRAAGPPPFAS